LNWLFDSIRRLIAAALVIALLACAVEVALRWHQYQLGLKSRAAHPTNIPFTPSRATGLQLPLAWYGTGQHAETEEPLPLRVNSLGIRGPEYPRVKPSGTLRILCLGDETTLAHGHAEEETYPGQLETLLDGSIAQPVEVINAGLPGGCPLTETIHFRRLLTTLQPDVVIVHVDISDAEDDRLYRTHLRVDDAGEPVAVVHPSLEVADGPLSNVAEQFALAKWLEGRLSQRVAGAQAVSNVDTFQEQLVAWSTNPAPDSGVSHVVQPLEYLKILLDSEGATLVIATCPNAWQAAELLRAERTHGGSNELLSAPSTAVVEAARKWNIATVDATSAVLRHPEPSRLYLRNGAGLTATGHALYAAELARALTGATISATR
jgi:hypothetical protein